MPFVIHPRVRKGLGRLAAMTAFGVLASSGVAAAASCQAHSHATPLARFGDTNNYFVAPGGSFEGSSLPAGAVASGATLTPGNEPFQVLGSSDSQSLTIAAGGSVTLPYTCIDSTMPDLRFFARQDAPGRGLKVAILIQAYGMTARVPLATLANGSMPSWGLTAPIHAPGGVTVPPGQVVQGAVQFSVPPGSGSWQIDDVLIDPYSFR